MNILCVVRYWWILWKFICECIHIIMLCFITLGFLCVGSISEVVVTFNQVGGSFNVFKCYHQVCMNNYIFTNSSLCAACWAHPMCVTNCGQHHWVTPFIFSIVLYTLLKESITRKYSIHILEILLVSLRFCLWGLRGCFPYTWLFLSFLITFFLVRLLLWYFGFFFSLWK